jgi:hypothetical protein
MATFGCHSCGVDLSKYPTYEESPCATCKLVNEYTNTRRAALFDSAIDTSDEEALEKYDISVEDRAHIDPIEYEARQVSKKLHGLESLKKTIENQVFVTASGLILKFVKLAKENPVLFEVVIKKMQFPHMSYSELGDSMNPVCSKQNILYHLKHAVSLFPELRSALLTDTRFTSGRYALQTVAQKTRHDMCEQRLQKIIYGDDFRLQSMTLNEIRAIVDAPFMTPDEVLNFNPYVKDEIDDEKELEEENENGAGTPSDTCQP